MDCKQFVQFDEPNFQEILYWVSATTLYSICIRRQNKLFSYPTPLEYPDYKSVDLEIAGLGAARSVRALKINNNFALTVGLTGGVIVWETGVPRTFRYPYESSSNQGYNSMAYSFPYLYATHSEYGLVRWDMRQQPSKGEVIQTKLFQNRKTMRALQIWNEQLYLACNEKVYVLCAKSAHRGNIAIYSGNTCEITGIVPKNDGVFACNSRGELLYWSEKDPDIPQKIVQYTQPIFMLRKNNQTEEILLSAKEMHLISLLPHKNTMKTKRCIADQPISWGIANRHTHIGVGEDLQTIYFWEDTYPNDFVPYNRDIGLYNKMELSDRILDLDILEN